jgi:hypothetical protein
MNQKRSTLDIPIFHKVYSLYKILISYYSSIPKMQRYTLWQRCENTTLSLLEILISTSHKKGEGRLAALHEMSNRLDLLKVLIRLAKETRLISIKQYTEIQSILQEIGKMIGGWIRSVPH